MGGSSPWDPSYPGASEADIASETPAPDITPSLAVTAAFSWGTWEDLYEQLGATSNEWEQTAIETMMNKLVQSETYVGEYASEAEQLANEGILGATGFFSVGLGIKAHLYDDYGLGPGI